MRTGSKHLIILCCSFVFFIKCNNSTNNSKVQEENSKQEFQQRVKEHKDTNSRNQKTGTLKNKKVTQDKLKGERYTIKRGYSLMDSGKIGYQEKMIHRNANLGPPSIVVNNQYVFIPDNHFQNIKRFKITTGKVKVSNRFYFPRPYRFRDLYGKKRRLYLVTDFDSLYCLNQSMEVVKKKYLWHNLGPKNINHSRNDSLVIFGGDSLFYFKPPECQGRLTKESDSFSYNSYHVGQHNYRGRYFNYNKEQDIFTIEVKDQKKRIKVPDFKLLPPVYNCINFDWNNRYFAYFYFNENKEKFIIKVIDHSGISLGEPVSDSGTYRKRDWPNQ